MASAVTQCVIGVETDRQTASAAAALALADAGFRPDGKLQGVRPIRHIGIPVFWRAAIAILPKSFGVVVTITVGFDVKSLGWAVGAGAAICLVLGVAMGVIGVFTGLAIIASTWHLCRRELPELCARLLAAIEVCAGNERAAATVGRLFPIAAGSAA